MQHPLFPRLRSVPQRVLIPTGIVSAVLLLATARAAFSPSTIPASQPAAEGKPAATAPAPTATTHGAAEAVAAAPPAASASMAQPAAPVAIAPPVGLVAGRVLAEQVGIDQFKRDVVLGTTLDRVDKLQFAVPLGAVAGAVASYKWSAWLNLSSPTVVARLLRGRAGFDGTVTIDSINVMHVDPYAPTSTDAVVTLPAGWHHVEIDVMPQGSGGAEIELDLGASVEALTSPAPWAVDPRTPAPASSEAEARP